MWQFVWTSKPIYYIFCTFALTCTQYWVSRCCLEPVNGQPVARSFKSVAGSWMAGCGVWECRCRTRAASSETQERASVTADGCSMHVIWSADQLHNPRRSSQRSGSAQCDNPRRIPSRATGRRARSHTAVDQAVVKCAQLSLAHAHCSARGAALSQTASAVELECSTATPTNKYTVTLYPRTTGHFWRIVHTYILCHHVRNQY